MLVGKVNIEGRSLYFDRNGEQVKGRFIRNANGTYSYYDKNSGDMLVGKVNIEGRSLYFDRNGEQVKGRAIQNLDGSYSLR
ncbi:Glucosyltransferase-SI [Apilactobacillus kunkeei]|nr:Glucosyltransferase-SI [Apilactobacillus kunkeei]